MSQADSSERRPRATPSTAEVAGGLVRLTRPDVEIVVDGSKAVVNGVVDGAAERRRIVEAVESLETVTEVENNLRARTT